VCAVVKRVSPKRDLNGVQEAGFTACSAVDRKYEVLRGVYVVDRLEIEVTVVVDVAAGH
jgi:hypothetical protein